MLDGLLRPKTPGRDGTTHLGTAPLEFMQWLVVPQELGWLE